MVQKSGWFNTFLSNLTLFIYHHFHLKPFWTLKFPFLLFPSPSLSSEQEGHGAKETAHSKLKTTFQKPRTLELTPPSDKSYELPARADTGSGCSRQYAWSLDLWSQAPTETMRGPPQCGQEWGLGQLWGQGLIVVILVQTSYTSYRLASPAVRTNHCFAPT